MARPTALWPASALALLLIGGVPIDAGAAQPATTPNKTLTKDQAKAVQIQQARALKGLDKNYREQAKALAKYYKDLAKQVSKSGGDAQPLLNVAAYYDSEATK